MFGRHRIEHTHKPKLVSALLDNKKRLMPASPVVRCGRQAQDGLQMARRFSDSATSTIVVAGGGFEPPTYGL